MSDAGLLLLLESGGASNKMATSRQKRTQRKQLPRRPPHRVGEAGMEMSSQQSKSCRELMIQEPIGEWVAGLATFSDSSGSPSTAQSWIRAELAVAVLPYTPQELCLSSVKNQSNTMREDISMYSYVQKNSSLTSLMCLSTDFGRNYDTTWELIHD